MRFHWQNLKKEDHSNHIYHGRCWFYFGERSQLGIEWAIPGNQLRFMLSLNHYDETAIGFSIDVFLFSLHFGIENRFLYNLLQHITRRRDQKYTNGREIGFYLWGDSMSIQIWNDPMESRHTDPFWMHTYFHFSDAILGRANCTKEVLKEKDVMVPMPEKSYPAHAKLTLYTWKRPRWFAHSMKRVEIDCPEGIPHPGKGTMSYNCGPDATYGMTTGRCNTIEEGIGQLVGSVLNDRERYPL